MTPLDKLVADLRGLGYNATIQVTVAAPPEQTPEVVSTGDREVATIRTRMWALNRLLAAPGQPNRELVRKFLWHVGWLGGAEEPEEWKLEHVPIKNSELRLLVSRIAQFEKDSKTPAPS